MYQKPENIDIVLERIRSLSLSEQQASVLHIDDMLQQLINDFLEKNELWKQKRSLRGGTWSSKARVIRDLVDREKYKLLIEYDKKLDKVRYGMPISEQLQQYWLSCCALVDGFGFHGKSVHSFLAQSMSVLNVVSVDTKRGYKLIQLCHGNVVDIKSGLLVLSTSNKPEATPSGLLVSHLKHRYNFICSKERPLLHFSPTEWSTVQEGTDDTPFRHLLQLCVGGSINEESLQTYIKRVAQGLFASVSALEILGIPTHTISLPVLQAHKISDETGYRVIIEALIRESISWLKRSESTDVINLCVYFGDELHIWSDAMDRVLGRTIVSVHTDSMMQMFLSRVLHEAEHHVHGPIGESVSSLKQVLSHTESLGVEHISVYARKLVESICKEVLKLHNRKTSGDLLSCIERLREGGIAAPWILSYMHNIRILGNENVHVREEGKVYTPNTMNSNDVISLLSSIQAVLQYWREVASSYGK